jgi:hypothetical protein
MTELVLSDDYLATTIYKIRNQKVILDRDIARLYGIPTKALKQAVRRNANRFPSDFMFELSEEEFENWRSQIVTSNSNGDKMGLRYAPMAQLKSILPACGRSSICANGCNNMKL